MPSKNNNDISGLNVEVGMQNIAGLGGKPEKKVFVKKELPKKPNVNLCVNPEEKQYWIKCFEAMDLTLSQGIRKAVNLILEEIEQEKRPKL